MRYGCDSYVEREGLAVLVVPDPKVVRRLLTRYASLQITLAESEGRERVRELEDVSYTLCITMGTRNVHEAIAAADTLLMARARRGSAQEPDSEDGLPMLV
ncbi:DUF5133 domain-containing protein [Streptomyces sp. NPDC059629]|uniref:DUF5133 domain-containing protein n=1 Tax=Streptomyces sp. NPDC059629 TaxID=3346889 RepID=UPI0036AFBBBD